MDPLAATAATLVLFFAPGTLLVAALGARRVELSLGEQVFVALAASLVVSGSLALALAELGVLTPGRAALAVAVLVLGAGLAAGRRRLVLRPGRVAAGELAALGGVLAVALALYFPPYEYVFGGRDPGVYVNAGFHVARHGELVWVDPLVRAVPPETRALFFRVDKEVPAWRHQRFLGYHLESPETGRVVPQGLHLYPVWIGLAAALFEMKAGLYATPFFATLGAAGFFLAVRRLFGGFVAGWATAWLAAFVIQIWFARFPNAEILVQFLYMTGLFAFAVMEEERSALAGALGGAALGATWLVRMESLLFVVPFGLYLGWRRLERRFGRPEAAFALAFAVVAAHAVAHAVLVSWPYVSNVLDRHYWRAVGRNLPWIALAAVVVGGIVDRRAAAIARPVRTLLDAERARLAAAGGVFLLATYAYFVRPVWHGARTAPHDAEAFLRMGWYLYPVGLGLAVGGAMLLVAEARARRGLFVLVGLTFSLFFFYKVRVWHDHFFAMRRFVPVILPSLLVCIAVLLAAVRELGGRHGRWAAAVVGSLLLGLYVASGRAVWTHREFEGSLAFVEELGRHIGEGDVVLFPRQEGLHLLELPLAELEGENVLEFYTLKPDRALLERLLNEWRGRFGDVYFVTNYKISLSGLFTRHVKDFWLATRKYEFAYDHPPRRVEPFHLRFSLSKAVDLRELAAKAPPLARVDLGASDDLFVAWFYEKEREPDGTTYRWSQRISSVFLPGLRETTRRLVIRLAGPETPPAPLAPVVVSLDGQRIGTIEPTRSFEEYAVEVPAEIARRAAAEGRPVVSLETTTWRPARWIDGATDIRDLGVRVDFIEVR